MHKATHAAQAEHHTGRRLLGLAVATAIATGIGILVTNTDKGEEIREEIVDKGKALAKKFKKTRKQMQEIIQNVFGEVRDDLEQAYVELQGQLLAEIDEMAKKDRSVFNKKSYEDMVHEAVQSFGEAREWSKDAMKNLKESLNEDWEEIKESLQD